MEKSEGSPKTNCPKEKAEKLHA